MTQNAWYVVHTKPHQEARAVENLQNQGFECYLPTVKVERLVKHKVVVVEEPMFSRYVFIRLSDPTKSWVPIRSTLGVSRLVIFGSQPAKVSDDIVAFLMVAPQDAIDRLFNKGDLVQITSGALAGASGVYQDYDGERQALVLIELIGQPHKVRLAIDALRPLNNP